MTNTKTQSVIGLIVFAVAAWYFFGGGLEMQASKDMKTLENQVASDAAAQYEIASRHADKMELCAQAGVVAASYLQAKDETNYAKWKAKEGLDCSAAGIPKS